MPLRGPYKQYEVDTSVAVPKSTLYERRKRRIAELDDEPNENFHEHGHAVAINQPESDGEADPIINFEDEPNFLNNGNDSDNSHQDEIDIHNVLLQGYGDVIDDIDEKIAAMPPLNDQNLLNQNNPLFQGANVTTAECLLLVLSYITRHHLTHEALQDLLTLLNVLLPNSIPPTKYRFFKAFDAGVFQIHYYCPTCMFYLGQSTTERNCESCCERFIAEECKKNGNYFLYLPMESQIKNLLGDEKLRQRYLTNHTVPGNINTGVISDLTSGQLYHELAERHNFSLNDLSLTWNTDGIPIFESSNYSIWPIQSVVNELPPHLREKNVLLHGLWFGSKKPAMNTFLTPFTEDCIQLETNGFIFEDEDHPRKVFAHVLSADSPARALVRNSKQYNGKHGCDWCESPGETIASGGPPTRYYPYRGPPVLRTAEKQIESGIDAANSADDVKGVKGPSVIGILPSFDQVRGIAVDFMHCVCLGVTRQFVNLWMDSKHHEQNYYIGRREHEINNRLQAIDVPSEISRAPRSIGDRKFWKASEWRTFIFYSLVVLNGILPQQYLKHFFLFVYGIYCLLGDSITDDAITSAEVCLIKFVIQTEEMYGLNSCTFNVHQLVHLADSVRNCGPLWSSAAFMFESNNHVLQQMFHGTQHVPRQIVEFYIIWKKIPQLVKGCFNEETSPAVHCLFEKLRDVKHFTSDACFTNGVRSVGKEKTVQLDASQVLAVQVLLGLEVRNNYAVVYSRFVASNKLFSSVDYVRSKRHINHNITFEHEQYEYGVILGLFAIKPRCSCNIAELQYCNCSCHNVVLVQPMVVKSRALYRDTDFNVNSFFLAEVEHAMMPVAIHPHQIKKKCISVIVDRKQYFCPLPYHINDN